jgi:hypothetical protein
LPAAHAVEEVTQGIASPTCKGTMRKTEHKPSFHPLRAILTFGVVVLAHASAWPERASEESSPASEIWRSGRRRSSPRPGLQRIAIPPRELLTDLRLIRQSDARRRTQDSVPIPEHATFSKVYEPNG